MSILDKKNKIMADVASLNTINEGLPKLKKTNSFSSINGSGDSVGFLMDLTKSLVGYKEMIDNLSDFLTRKLPEIESAIKKDLKKEIKQLCSCSVNPSIPAWFRSGGAGVVLNISDVDFFGITKVDPESPYGALIYEDYQAGVNSKDFNTFLFSNITQNKSDYTPNGGSISTWGTSTTTQPILDIKFSPVGTTENNVIKFNSNANYDNKTLYEFNVNLIDSISLFGSPDTLSSDKILNLLVDDLFGTISSKINKSKSQLQKEEEIKECLNCILNSDDGEAIDDSFFSFSNEQLIKINEKANNRKNGVGIIDTYDNREVSVPIDSLLQTTQNFADATSNTTSPIPILEQQHTSIKNALNTLADLQAQNETSEDKNTVKNNFLLELVKSLAKGIMTIVMSPKLISVYAINYQILYGQNETYDGPIDFIKKNKNLIKSLSKTILELVIKLLLTLIIKFLSKKLSQKFAQDEIERGKNYIAQILSLIGTPPEIIRQIQNISYVAV
jgi:hypothetical protein